MREEEEEEEGIATEMVSGIVTVTVTGIVVSSVVSVVSAIVVVEIGIGTVTETETETESAMEGTVPDTGTMTTHLAGSDITTMAGMMIRASGGGIDLLRYPSFPLRLSTLWSPFSVSLACAYEPKGVTLSLAHAIGLVAGVVRNEDS